MGDSKTKYYDELGDQFEEFMSDYDVERRLSLIFQTLLAPEDLAGKRVLEIGSGTGRFSRIIKDLGGNLTILDIGEGLVREVSQELTCNGVVGDTLALPFAAGSYDIIISSECIEHTVQPETAIREMCRVCAPNGLVCITAPNKLWYPALRLGQIIGVRKYSGIENWMFPKKAAIIMQQENMNRILIAGCHLWPFQIKFAQPLLRKMDRLSRWLYPAMINFGIVGRKAETLQASQE
jgi:ubiquinone/menaquinone biosynthesis C-methylase UbiE